MFSIARFDDQRDGPSYERQKDRLSKLNARLKPKRKYEHEQPEVPHENNADSRPQPQRIDAGNSAAKPPQKTKMNSKKKKRRELSTEELERFASQRAAAEAVPTSASPPVDEREFMDVDSEDVPEDNEIPEVIGLQAFPDFQPKQPTRDTAAMRSMGIPDWLANPTIVAPETATPVEESVFGLNKKLTGRCKELGIEEFFASKRLLYLSFFVREA
ncbi:hypothetical protein BC936DRAFT_148225 [Jimgerdemannia flammicorona]|uniref:Uncharacterized protein n=1 Tax=Jimgerdemannia flammicorona TaxID=994334 RepID=A0A433D3J1_9FUNG|nr:hypothetical protein BC936DRAFT_148225 [Jimgerdemannia flammicorona]